MQPCSKCKFFKETKNSGRRCWKRANMNITAESVITDGCFSTKPEVPEPTLVDFDRADVNLAVLRRVLLRARWDHQGGFPGYQGGGRWLFVSAGLPQASPQEWNALLELAGIVPDKIEPLGSCSTCRFSINGRERGYDAPCAACQRPRMSFWEAKDD